LKDKIEKIILIIQKDFKIAIKRMRIKIKNKINFLFDWKVKLKIITNLAKEKKRGHKNEDHNSHKK
jgi:hypothetical protein